MAAAACTWSASSIAPVSRPDVVHAAGLGPRPRCPGWSPRGGRTAAAGESHHEARGGGDARPAHGGARPRASCSCRTPHRARRVAPRADVPNLDASGCRRRDRLRAGRDGRPRVGPGGRGGRGVGGAGRRLRLRGARDVRRARVMARHRGADRAGPSATSRPSRWPPAGSTELDKPDVEVLYASTRSPAAGPAA
jgi:hypothetical protein